MKDTGVWLRDRRGMQNAVIWGPTLGSTYLERDWFADPQKDHRYFSRDRLPADAVPLVRRDEADAALDRLSAKADEFMAERDALQEQVTRDAFTIAELRAQVEQAEACCGCDHGGHHVLPTPDATNPDHLRFAAEMIEMARPGGNSWARPRQRNVLAEDLRGQADRIEREHAEVDATEKLIEKATEVVRVEYARAPWGVNAFEQGARALHAAGLLRDGGES